MRYTHYDEYKKRWQINDDYGAVMIDKLNYAIGEAVDKLAAYEDAEEQGLLVRLPCKVGDTVFSAFEDEDVFCGKVYAISTCDGTDWFSVRYDSGLRYDHPWDHFGKIVFRTRAEAEAALKGESKDV